MVIAGLKALLIIFFFMHFKRMELVVKLYTFGGLFWLFVMFLYTFSDYVSRNWLNAPSVWK
jgi:caa(3)-type oxidase subunit IV